LITEPNIEPAGYGIAVLTAQSAVGLMSTKADASKPPFVDRREVFGAYRIASKSSRVKGPEAQTAKFQAEESKRREAQECETIGGFQVRKLVCERRADDRDRRKSRNSRPLSDLPAGSVRLT
jgi:hypothetical protein